jgi:hypothetical protein
MVMTRTDKKTSQYNTALSNTAITKGCAQLTGAEKSVENMHAMPSKNSRTKECKLKIS